MARSRIYPVANRTAQWWEDKFSRTTMNPVSKLLLHTTETAGWPAYSAGASAPSLTYNPWMAASSNRWRQHNYLDRSSRALRDPSGTAVRENQDGVVQVEIVCYCDPGLYRQYGKGVNVLPDHAYEDLGNLLAFLNREWSVPLRRAPEWDTYPPSDSIRMTGPEYDAFTGVLGHQHASGNTHGDPGMTNAQVDRILTVAKRINGAPKPPATSPPKEVDDMSAADVKAITDHIDAVQKTIEAGRYAQIIEEGRAQEVRIKDALTAALDAQGVTVAAAISAAMDRQTKAITDLAAKLPATQ